MTETPDDKKPRKSLHDNLNEVFGLPSAEPTADTNNELVPIDQEGLPAVNKTVVDKDALQIEQDFQDTRNTLIDLEQTGMDVLDHFTRIAKESESPRSIEVLGNFMKTISDISLSKIDIHEKKKKLKADQPDQPTPGSMNIQNANIVVGTTADVLKQLKKPE